jgi:hypothetical protein
MYLAISILLQSLVGSNPVERHDIIQGRTALNLRL